MPGQDWYHFSICLSERKADFCYCIEEKGPIKLKDKIYKTIVKPAMVYGLNAGQ